MKPGDQRLIQVLFKLARENQHKGDLLCAAECYTQIVKLSDPDTPLYSIAYAHASACLNILQTDATK